MKKKAPASPARTCLSPHDKLIALIYKIGGAVRTNRTAFVKRGNFVYKVRVKHPAP
jgi:hypothetical protein